jgi:hypothetical protein
MTAVELHRKRKIEKTMAKGGDSENQRERGRNWRQCSSIGKGRLKRQVSPLPKKSKLARVPRKLLTPI